MAGDPVPGNAATAARGCPTKWTPERLALAQRLWEVDGLRAEKIVERVNALPGEALGASGQAVYGEARKRGWTRPAKPSATAPERAPEPARTGPDFRGAIAGPAFHDAVVPSYRQPADRSPAPAASATTAIPFEGEGDRAEAMRMFDAGKSARDAAADLFVPLSLVSVWKGDWDRDRAAREERA